MANVQVTLPVEHADELLGTMAPMLPNLYAPAAPNPDVSGMAAGTPPPDLPPAVLPSITNPTEEKIGQLEQRIAQDTAPPKPYSQLSGWGKTGRVLGDIAQAAGSALVPQAMPVIPGTMQNRALRLGLDERTLAGLQKSQMGTSELARSQAATRQAEAQTGLIGAQTGEAQARTALTGEQAQLYQQAAQAMQDPNLHNAFNTLADTKSTPDQRRNAMATISQSPIAMVPALRGEMMGAGQLYREGETGSRVQGHNLIVDPNSPTGYSTLQYDRFNNPMGLMPVEPSASDLLMMGPQAGQYMGAATNLAGMKAGAVQAQGLVPIYDPQTNDVIGYAPKGGIAGATGAGPTGMQQAMAGGLTPKPTGMSESSAQGAASVQSMISDNIIPMVDQADKAGVMGPVSGRVQEWVLKHIGDPNPVAAELAAQLQAIPMMLGRMYGYHSAQYAESLDNYASLKMTPDAIKGYLKGVTAHAKTIAEQGGMGPKKSAPTGGGAGIKITRDAQGNITGIE